MSHDLTQQSTGEYEFFYFGATPWHGLGNKVDRTLTSAEAIEAAHLDWEVEKRFLYTYQDNERMKEVDSHRAVIRKDTGEFLGIVGKNYRIVQNTEAFGIIDAIVESSEAIFHTAGSIREGRRIWGLVKLPDSLMVTPQDQIDKYLLIANAHDGTQSLTIKFTPIRVVCNNTLSAALPEWGQSGTERTDDPTVYIRHTDSATVRIEEAKRILGIARKQFDELGEGFKALSATQINEIIFKEYLEKIFPLRLPSKSPSNREMQRALDSQKRHHALVSHLYENGAGAAPGTLWGAYNSVTEYMDHVYVATQAGELKKHGLESALFGVGAETKERAFAEAIALV